MAGRLRTSEHGRKEEQNAVIFLLFVFFRWYYLTFSPSNNTLERCASIILCMTIIVVPWFAATIHARCCLLLLLTSSRAKAPWACVHGDNHNRRIGQGYSSQHAACQTYPNSCRNRQTSQSSASHATRAAWNEDPIWGKFCKRKKSKVSIHCLPWTRSLLASIAAIVLLTWGIPTTRETHDFPLAPAVRGGLVAPPT